MAPLLRSSKRPLGDYGDHLIGDSTDVPSYVCFPESKNDPAQRFKLLGLFNIPRGIPANLGDPVAGVVSPGEFRDTGFQVAPVPEVAVAEHSHTRLGKNDVGSAGQTSVAQPIAEPAGQKFTTKNQFAEGARFPACSACRTRGGWRSWTQADEGRLQRLHYGCPLTSHGLPERIMGTRPLPI